MSQELQVERTVESYLEDVNYSDYLDYVPSAFALGFIAFLKLVNGSEGEENETPIAHMIMLDQLAGEESQIANLCARGFAKALPLDSLLFAENGRLSIAEAEIGDRIYGEDGRLTTITHKSEIFNKPMYRIYLEDGRTQEVSEDHINVVIQRRRVRYGKKTVGELQRRNLTTKELLEYSITSTRPKTKKNPKGYTCNFWIPNCQAIEYSTKEYQVDPYTLGCILGDGNIGPTGHVRLTAHKDDMPHYIEHLAFEIGTIYTDKRNVNVKTLPLLKSGKPLKKLGLAGCHGNHKFIPECYLYGSIKQRTQLLMGLMDTDGTVSKTGNRAFTSNSKALCEGVMALVRSLGGTASISPMNTSYRVSIKINKQICSLSRKALRERYDHAEQVGIKAIVPIDEIPSQCIRVDNSSHTFIIDDYTVTHNTAIFAEYLFLYIGVYGELPNFGKVNLALYVSDSIENGVKNLRKNIEHRWNNSEFLQKYIPETRFTDIRLEFTNVSGKKFIVKSYGAKTGVRGAKELGQRPTLAVLDDLVSDEDARSATVIASIEDTVYKAVSFALHPTKQKTIWSGTPFNSKDPLYKAIESGAWAVNVFPVCEEFPCEEKDFKSGWPDRFTYKYVKQKYDIGMKTGKIDTFNQELMLRIMSDEDRLILEGDIQWYFRDHLMVNKDMFNFYITTDFATSDSAGADFSVISVWAHNHNGDWFLVNGTMAKQQMDANIDDLFRMVQEYKPESTGIEISGQQGGFISWIQNEMQRRRIFFNLAREKGSNKMGIRPTTDKLQRFRQTEPLFKMGKVYFPEEMKGTAFMKEALNELYLAAFSGFKSKHDDFLDTVGMLSVIPAWRPSEPGAMKKKDKARNNLWDFDIEEPEDNFQSYLV